MRTNNQKRHLTPCRHSSTYSHLVNRHQSAPLQSLAHPAGSPTGQKYRIQVLAVQPANSIGSVPPQPKLSFHPRLRPIHLKIHHLQQTRLNQQQRVTHPPTWQQLLHLTLSISRTSPLPRTTLPQPPLKTTQPKTMTS